MAFEVYKQHKLEDRMEGEAYDWVLWSIQEQYGVDDWDELTREQVDEIYAYANSEPEYSFAPYVESILVSSCDNWYYENEELENDAHS